MKISELRIGNLVLCEGNVAEIKALDGRTNNVSVWTGGRGWCSRGWCGNVDKLQPILLTHRVLEACGFTENSPGWYVVMHPELEKYYLCEKEYCKWAIMDEYGDAEYNSWQTDVCSVHELQNYFYALKGEELKIDEDKLREAII